MSKINVMNTDLANKIAAGEVIEKLMNVVKELVENSIDAKSTEIHIDLIDSGVESITVTDNGIGMDKEDATKCFLSHATSKINNLNDLFNLNSLGFRGEALPSIASVSKVELKTSNGEEGTIVLINGGKIESVTNSSLRKGTMIKVSNVFYNTPVRLKYLRSLNTELANIVEYVNKMALSFPNIKFVLTNNSKELLNTTGTGNLLKVINDIYGIEITKKMIEIDSSNEDYHIIGYVSYPECNKANKNNITLLVNNRYIKNYEISKVIKECYHTYIPVDRYPICVINIIADPFLVDCNIHPTKMDVKFSKIDTLSNLISETITKALKKTLLIPEISINTDNFNLDEKPINEVFYKPEEIRLDFNVSDNNEMYLNTVSNKQEINNEVKEINKDFIEEKIDKHEVDIKPMFPVGNVFGTYIIAYNEDGMYLIDQHAAAERINYENTYQAILNHSKNIIDLLIPITIELTNDEYIKLSKHFDILDRLGFNYMEFGTNTIVIKGHPVWLKDYRVEDGIKKIIEIIINTNDFSELKFYDHISMTMACKMSIKGNEAITMEDMQYLLNKLIKCNNPYTCPHGRPTVITYSKYELEKLFKRAM